MKLSDQIEAARNELITLKDSLVEATKALEAVPDDDALLAQVTELTGQVEKKAASVDALTKAEAALIERAKSAPAIVQSVGKPEDAKELWAKQATCAFVAHCKKITIDAARELIYPGNKALEAIAQKSAVAPATTYTTGWAAELVQSDVQGFINLLTPLSVTAAISGRTYMTQFGGYDTVTIPRRAARAAGTTVGGAFVGEGGAIPLGRIGLSSTTLSRYKQAVITPFTRELAERSTPAIEGVLRQAILDDMSMSLDAVFLGSSAAVTGIQPAGLANGVTPITGDTTGGVDSVIADIKAALTALQNAMLGVRPVLILNTIDALSAGLMQTALGEFIFRDELNSGRLLGIDVIKSQNMAQGTFYLVDAAALATAFDAPMFDVNDVATVVEANADATAPTMANGGTDGAVGTAGQVPRAGGIGVVGTSGTAATGYTARSLWQTYSVGIRSVQPVSWGVIQPNAVVIVNSLVW